MAHGEMRSRWRSECASERANLMREAMLRESLSADWISDASREMKIGQTGVDLDLGAKEDVHGFGLMMVYRCI